MRQGDVNVTDIDWDIVEDGCNGEVLCSGVTGDEGVGGKVGEGNGLVNGGDKSSTTRVTRTVLTDSDVVWKGVIWQVPGWFQF